MGSGRSWSLLGHFDPTTGGANQEETIRERYKCVKSDVLVPEARKSAPRASLCLSFMVTKRSVLAQHHARRFEEPNGPFCLIRHLRRRGTQP